MKSLVLTLTLLFSLSSFAQQKDEAFFYVIFSKCQENFVNFPRSKTIDNNDRENYSLVCTDKLKFVDCKLLDSKGKLFREDRTKKNLNVPGLTIFKGDLGMEITVFKGTGGVLFTQTSANDLQSVTQLVCRGEVKDASDLKNLEKSKELLGPKKVPSMIKPDPATKAQEMIGD